LIEHDVIELCHRFFISLQFVHVESLSDDA
jgi:hypothetical protein